MFSSPVGCFSAVAPHHWFWSTDSNDLSPSVEGGVSLRCALSFSTDPSPTVHHSILHHRSPPGGNQAYDTLSLESSDSLETSVSTGNSICAPERWEAGKKEQSALFPWELPNLPPRLEERSPFFVPATNRFVTRDYAGCCHANPLKFWSSDYWR